MSQLQTKVLPSRASKRSDNNFENKATFTETILFRDKFSLLSRRRGANTSGSHDWMALSQRVRFLSCVVLLNMPTGNVLIPHCLRSTLRKLCKF